MNAQTKRRASNVGFYILVFLVIAYCVLPFAWQIFTSFKYDRDINQLPPVVPATLTLDHYRNVLGFNNFNNYVQTA